MSIKVGIVGYGNLGKGVETAVLKNKDIKLIGIFSRREPKDIQSIFGKVLPYSTIEDYIGKIDVMILCGGSATDILIQGPYIASMFNTVDAFDTHAKISDYMQTLENICKESNTLSMVSTGWDPGLFSYVRVLSDAILPDGMSHTFWGKGVSQGHSDAIRRIEGVVDARQYTVPNEEVKTKIRNGEQLNISTYDKHSRLCYVVVEDNADKLLIEKEIKEMPNYFSDYETTVKFVDLETLRKKHNKLPHGGNVIRLGKTSEDNKDVVEFSLKLDSNPEFTGSVMVACARAVYRLSKENKKGSITMMDVPLTYFIDKDRKEIIKEYM
ncbi:MAG: diaminopimelate dehydrogenase [Erysipelotrichaceae bacterium]|nr:diaminopimelate dehydrogenase [Erysipelotrichaceae bacterium]